MSPTKAKYVPLARDGNSIRMLAIRSSLRSRARLKLDLIYVDLDDLEPAPFAFYEALSYTWGDVSDTVPCDLNGLDHRITRNLAAALRYLRGRTRKRYIWVDALCINQEDIAERGHQVGIMRRIYSQAEQVLVWLGTEAPYTKDVIDKLDWVDELEFGNEQQLLDSLDSAAHLESWKDVARFLDHPWFRRVWICQEVALAREIMLICGKQLIQWNALHHACGRLDDSDGRFLAIVTEVSDKGSGQKTTLQMEKFRQQLLNESQPVLERLLLHARGADVTDPRDRVYGMLGLAGPGGDDIEVDYNLTKEDVFKDAMVALLNGESGLDSLSGCQWSSSQDPAFPSWVINLDEDWDGMILRLREDSEGLYTASANSEANFQISDDRSKLFVEGHALDTIIAIGSAFTDASKLGDTISEFMQIVLNHNSFWSSNQSTKDFIARFARIIVADTDDQINRATSTFLADYASHETIKSFIDFLAYRYEYTAGPYVLRVQEVCENRRGFVTMNGLIGLAGSEVATGDVVCLFLGAGVPFIIRPRDDGTYTLIGEAYVDEIMDGEAFQELQASAQATSIFTIR